jgi:hypothetical protein
MTQKVGCKVLKFSVTFVRKLSGKCCVSVVLPYFCVEVNCELETGETVHREVYTILCETKSARYIRSI